MCCAGVPEILTEEGLNINLNDGGGENGGGSSACSPIVCGGLNRSKGAEGTISRKGKSGCSTNFSRGGGSGGGTTPP